MLRNRYCVMFGAATAVLVVATVMTPAGAARPRVTQPACEAKYGTLARPRLSISFSDQSEIDPDKVYITVTGDPTGATPIGIHPCTVFNKSRKLSELPRFEKGPRWRHLEIGSGIGSGIVWISYGAPLKGLPTTQPSFDTTTTRFASVEFAFPGQADMTNVDQFSFPVDLVTYSTKDGRDHLKKLQSRWYSGNTCSIVGGLKTGVTNYNSTYTGILPKAQRASWPQIVVRDANGNFVRVVSPKQRTHQPPTTGGAANPYAQGWPSMTPYVTSLAGQSITVEGVFTPGTGSSYLS